MEKLLCYKCGKRFEPGNRPDGIPNGVGFVSEDGTEVIVCAECIMKLGELREDDEL